MAIAAGRYVFEIARPLGWHVPPVPPPSGAMLLTVGGVPPGDATAAIMVRPVPKGDETLTDFVERELAAMSRSFAEGVVSELDGIEFPGRAWVARQLLGANQQPHAMLTVLEESDHFVWFGLRIADKSQRHKAPRVYRRVLRSFREQPYSALVASMHDAT